VLEINGSGMLTPQEEDHGDTEQLLVVKEEEIGTCDHEHENIFEDESCKNDMQKLTWSIKKKGEE
jgi:hypothetical protein